MMQHALARSVFMPVSRLFRRLGLLLPGIVLLALLAGWASFRLSENAGLQALQQTGGERLDIAAASLDLEIEKYAYFPATLALQRDVSEMLAGRDSLAAEVNTYLEKLNRLAGTLVIYVLDRDGKVVASSNWNQPDSFIGEDLSYRAYYDEAVQGRPGRFFGIGTTRGETGYYLSSPLRDKDGLTGVAVVKISLEQLERSWASLEAPAIVTDEHGVVILASEPAWKFMTLRPLDDAVRRRLEFSLQYNARPLLPLGVEPLRVMDEHVTLVRIPRAPGSDALVAPLAGDFLAQTEPLGASGWTLTVLSPVEQVAIMAWTRALLAAVAATLACILLLLWNQRRLHLRDRLRAREALQQAHQDLERRFEERTRNLQTTQEELLHAGRLAVIGQLSAELAHELNQPLAALRTLSGNAVKFMQRGNLAAAEGNLERIGSLVDTMGALTGRLKLFARKSSGSAESVAVRRMVDNALFLLAPRLRQAQAALHLAVPEGVFALCEATRLEQVLVNLLGNALDAVEGRADAALWVEAWEADGRVVVQVRDNGPGLAPEALNHLFEPFFTTKDAGRGLGLGLAIAAGIVRDADGTLSAVNDMSGGAVFTVDLPAVPGAPHA